MQAELVARDTERPFKVCGCSAQYSAAAWRSLRYVGLQPVPATALEPAEELELRDCANCGSTIAVVVGT